MATDENECVYWRSRLEQKRRLQLQRYDRMKNKLRLVTKCSFGNGESKWKTSPSKGRAIPVVRSDFSSARDSCSRQADLSDDYCKCTDSEEVGDSVCLYPVELENSEGRLSRYKGYKSRNQGSNDVTEDEANKEECFIGEDDLCPKLEEIKRHSYPYDTNDNRFPISKQQKRRNTAKADEKFLHKEKSELYNNSADLHYTRALLERQRRRKLRSKSVSSDETFLCEHPTQSDHVQESTTVETTKAGQTRSQRIAKIIRNQSKHEVGIQTKIEPICVYKVISNKKEPRETQFKEKNDSQAKRLEEKDMLDETPLDTPIYKSRRNNFRKVSFDGEKCTKRSLDKISKNCDKNFVIIHPQFPLCLILGFVISLLWFWIFCKMFQLRSPKLFQMCLVWMLNINSTAILVNLWDKLMMMIKSDWYRVPGALVILIDMLGGVPGHTLSMIFHPEYKSTSHQNIFVFVICCHVYFLWFFYRRILKF